REGRVMIPPSRHRTQDRFTSRLVGLCNWYHPVVAFGVVWRLAAPGSRSRLKVWHLIAMVALAAVAGWGYIERHCFLAWSWDARSERWLLDAAAARDAEAAAAERNAGAGLPFVPRAGFMPYGPTPVGGHEPRSWEEERKYWAEQARILRSEADT